MGTSKVQNRNYDNQGGRALYGAVGEYCRKNDPVGLAERILKYNDVYHISTDAKRQLALVLARDPTDSDVIEAVAKLAASCKSEAEFNAVFAGTPFQCPENLKGKNMIDPSYAARSTEAAAKLETLLALLQDPNADPRLKEMICAQFGTPGNVQATLTEMRAAIDALKNQAFIIENKPEQIDMAEEVSCMKQNVASVEDGLANLKLNASVAGVPVPSYAADAAGVGGSGSGSSSTSSEGGEAAGSSDPIEKARMKFDELKKRYPGPFDLADAFMSGDLDYDDVSDPLVQMMIQAELQDRTQLINFLSNLTKAEHDQAMSVIRNMV